MKKLMVTGSSGLIGSACVEYFEGLGWEVHGVDNNLRRDFFGPDGDTTKNLERLKARTHCFHHYPLDIRNREGVAELVDRICPSFVIHCAAQPSHDLAASRPFDDFDVNAAGTVNLLEAIRNRASDAVFCFLSTNKVYGDAPNELPLKECDTRWDYADPKDVQGIDERMRIDQSTHSLFGASKVAADLMVQEYGRYFGMATACFRGGCLTGTAHAAAELHGFLAYIFKCIELNRPYQVFGYKGKQVRDNIHAYDVCRALEAFYHQPRSGEVYNLGGERGNSVSVMEAMKLAEEATGKKLASTYVDEHRIGDHICYISDMSKFKAHYPSWSITKSLSEIFSEFASMVAVG